jgi:hypothetical protein
MVHAPEEGFNFLSSNGDRDFFPLFSLVITAYKV